MRLSQQRKILYIKGFFYFLFVVYLIGDLFLWKGFLHHRLYPSLDKQEVTSKEEKTSPIVAQIYGETITQEDLNTQTKAYIWRKGKTPSFYTLKELRLIKIAVLNNLINEELLRIKTKYNDLSLPISSKEIDQAYENFRLKFDTEKAFEEALSQQHLTKKTLRFYLEGQLKKLAQLDKVLKDLIPTENEILEAYALLSQKTSPECTGVISGVFIPTLHKTTETFETDKKLGYDFIQQGKPLPKESEIVILDQVVLSNKRPLPHQLEATILNGKENELREITTNSGTYLITLSDKKTIDFPEYKDLRESLRTALISQKRELGVDLYLKQLWGEANGAKHLHIFYENI